MKPLSTKQAKHIVFLAFLLLLQLPAFASHMSGGELSYLMLSQNEVLLQAKIYRRCSAITPQAEPFSLKPGCSSATYKISTNISSGIDITPTCKSTCTTCKSATCTSGFGVEEYTLLSYVNLSGYGCCEFEFSTEHCCRSTDITTGGSGENFYISATFNKCASITDHYMGFEYKPMFYVCKDQCVSVLHSADTYNYFSTSPRDSISYEQISPLKAKGSNIPYNSGYSITEPLKYASYPNAGTSFSNGCGGFHFNKATGEMNFKAANNDITLMAVRAIIWQKNSSGIYAKIGSFTRDIRVDVVSCPSNRAPVIKGVDGIVGNTVYVPAGETLKFTMDVSDPDGDSLTFSASLPIQNLQYKKSTKKAVVPQDTFIFSPDASQISNKLYSVIYTAKDNACPLPAVTQKIIFLKVVPAWPKVEIFTKNSSCGSFYLSATSVPSLGLKYKWIINGKTESEKDSFLYLPKDNRDYRIKLELTANNGSSKILYDTVKVTKVANADAGADTLGTCVGGSVQLNASGGVKYKWSPKHGLLNDSIANPVASPDSTLQYFVEVTDSNGCKATDSVVVTITDLLVEVSDDTAMCKKSNRYAKIKAVAPDAIRFAWSPNLYISDSTQAETYVKPTETTTYTVYATNKDGCTRSKQVTVFVNNPKANAGPDKTICLGDSVQLQGSGGSSYSWFNAVDLSNNYIANPWAKPTQSKYYLLYISDSIGCNAGPDTVYIKVNKLSTSISSSKTICKGDSVKLNISGGHIYKWWPQENISNEKSSSPVVYPKKTTTYFVETTDTSTGCKKTDSVKVKVNAVNYTITGTKNICLGDTASLNINGGSAYKWWPATNISGGSTSSPKFFPTVSTTYHVEITSTAIGCKTIDSVRIIVDTSCVWPGDANFDKTADYLDILDIALGYSTTGSPRINASTDWQPQISNDWSNSLSSGINYKHVDTNGDSVIDATDTFAVAKNYGKTHLKNDEPELAGNPNDPPLYFRFDKNYYLAGETVKATLYLGNADKPVKDVYGLGLKHFFANTYMEQASYNFSWDCEMLCGAKDNFQLYRQFNDKGTGEGSIIRTDKLTTSNPYGKVANIEFVLRDSTFNYPKSGTNISLEILKSRLIDMNGNEIPVYTKVDSVKVYRTQNDVVGLKENNNLRSEINIYPNPANNMVYIDAGEQRLNEVAIVNILGEIVIFSTENTSKTSVNIQALRTGIYFLRVKTGNQFSQHKLIISR